MDMRFVVPVRKVISWLRRDWVIAPGRAWDPRIFSPGERALLSVPSAGRYHRRMEHSPACLCCEGNLLLPSQRWMTPDLIHRTCALWSRRYSRQISPAEAVEILANVREFAEVMMGQPSREGLS
jgi:hypothetical protein